MTSWHSEGEVWDAWSLSSLQVELQLSLSVKNTWKPAVFRSHWEGRDRKATALHTPSGRLFPGKIDGGELSVVLVFVVAL